MKLRFTSLDIKVIAHELSSTLLDHRLTNIHDVTSQIFQLKFHTLTSKHILLVNSGIRAHLSAFSRTVAPTPSAFVSKLRKHLKTRRVTGIRQIGTDRILQLDFTDGLYRLFIEFFAGGNVILTDRENKILAVHRVVVTVDKDDEGNVTGTTKVAVGEKYTIDDKQGVKGWEELNITMERLKEALESAAAEDSAAQEQQQQEEREVKAEKKRGGKGKGNQQKQAPQKKQPKKKKKEDKLKDALRLKFTQLSPTLIEHILLEAGVDPSIKAADTLEDEELCEKVLDALKKGQTIVAELASGKSVKGYIIAKKPADKHAAQQPDKDKQKEKKTVKFGGEFDEPAESSKSAEDRAAAEAEEEEMSNVVPNMDKDGYLYDDFHPFLPTQFLNKEDTYHVIEVEGYNNTVDKFYSSIESQKLSARINEKHAQAAQKLENARKKHEALVEGLNKQQELHIMRAEAIENNAERVDEAIAAVNSLVARGMDWGDIAQLIDRERQRQNPVAEMIDSLKLAENTIVLNLGTGDGDESEDDEGDETASEDSGDEGAAAQSTPTSVIKVEVQLSLNSYKNARHYYDSRKSAAEQQSKTLQNEKKALKSQEKRIQADLKKGLKAEKMELRNLRKQGWWEKFFWFKSSEGYLVLGARDATQTEMLYKKYFKRGDVYVHADPQGSCHVIVKNNPATAKDPIPPATLSQAGTLAVCTSKAWDNKQVISAWWVDYDQVSKIGAGGQVLPVGDLAVKGDKKWLPPAMLVMGFAIGWVAKKAAGTENADDDEEDGAEDGDTKEAQEGQDGEAKEEEDSEDEEFPDTKLESGADEDEEHVEDKQEDSDDEDDEFPDTKIEDENTPAQDATVEAAEPSIESSVATLLVADEADETGSNAGSAAGGRKHLSAKEKRDLKKGKNKLSDSQTASENPSRSATPSQQGKIKQQQQPQVRGKKGKQKKMKEKYADQDELERQEALRLLGSVSANSGGGPAPEKKQSAAQLAAIEKQERMRAIQAKAAEKTLEGEKTRKENAENYFDFEEGYAPDSTLLMSDLAAILPAPPAAPAESAEEEKVDGEGKAEANASDVIPVPICAPWSALQKYQWKAKIQPGNDKKGKATREIVERWLRVGEKDLKDSKGKKREAEDDKGKEKDEAGFSPKEKQLVKAWQGAEIAQAVPVTRMKVMMTGGGLDKGDKGKSSKKNYEERDSGKGKGSGGGKGGGKKGKK